jgi:hypothetical protein
MISTYDVFRITNGKPQWLSSANTLAEARKKVDLADGDHFVIFNQETQEKITVKPEVKPGVTGRIHKLT